ncbi:Transketolase, partial [human gut metagenome]
DLSKSTKTNGFKTEFKDRFFNAGIAEQNLMGMAAGMANVGLVPFASTFAVFASGRAFEIIRNSICYPKVNVKIAATHAIPYDSLVAFPISNFSFILCKN